MTRKNFEKKVAAILAARKVEVNVLVVIVPVAVSMWLMAEDAKAAIGRISGLIIFMASIPYMISIFKKETTPNRTSWWIWTMLSVLLVTSYHESGARNTIWVPLIYVADQGLVALISLHPKYGEGGKRGLDMACGLGAIIGVMLWWISGPVLALMFFIMSDMFGSLPTAEKAFERPKSEDLFAWSLTFIGNAMNIFAAEKMTAEILAYPVYAAAMSGVILYPLIFKREQVPVV